jgi:SAM-dependent methyltransferase
MAEACPACGQTGAREAYCGRVRDGAHGSWREQARVYACTSCGLERLEESACLPTAAYASTEYRDKLAQSSDVAAQHALHDRQQQQHLGLLLPLGLRGKSLLDVGAGAGTLVDHVRGLLARVAVVEPMALFRQLLAEQGYETYEYAEHALEQGARFDLVTSFQVLEHVEDPLALLRTMRRLLADDGKLVLTTPNKQDLLMQLSPELFAPFFYRTAHRWYFDASSLERCAARAGFRGVEVSTVHRQGLYNAFGWLRERVPVSDKRHPLFDRQADAWWKSYLELHGAGDTLVLIGAP